MIKPTDSGGLPGWTGSRVTADLPPNAVWPPVDRAGSSNGNGADEDPAGSRFRRRPIVVAAAVALVVAAGVWALTALGPNDRESATAESAAKAPAEPDGDVSETAVGQATASESAQASVPVESAPAELAGNSATVEPSAETIASFDRDTVDWNRDGRLGDVAAAADETAWAVFNDYTLSVRGTLPSDEIVEEFRRRLSNVVGPDNVSDDYTVDPDVADPVDPPLFIQEGVVFEPDSTEIQTASETFLRLAVVVMARFPQTELTIVHHSYPVDGAMVGEQVARAEADAVMSFWTEAGVDPARLSTDLIAYSDPDARFGDVDGELDGRWIEFVVRGLLRDNPDAEG